MDINKISYPNGLLNNLIIIKEQDNNISWFSEIKENYLIISLNYINKNIEMYQIQKNLEDWKKIHYAFNGFRNLEQIQEFFLKALKMEDIQIKKKENKVLIEVSIEILYEKQIIPIELNKKEVNKDELIRQLYDIINNIQKETKDKNNNNIEGLTKELEEQKEEINFLKKEIEKLNNINIFRELHYLYT